MKKIMLLLLFTAFAQAQIINFPDVNLKTKLLAANASNTIASDSEWGAYTKIDLDNNGEIEVSEALLIKRLNLASSSISNLSGLENFPNLLLLDLLQNSVSDISMINPVNFPQLKDFQCKSNNISSLNSLMGMNSLLYLECQNNPIMNIDLGDMPNLIRFYCGGNGYPGSVDLSGLTGLYYFACSQGNLTSLDLTGLTQLRQLGCRLNNLTSIDLTPLNPDVFESFIAEFNQLSIVDLNRFPNLQSVAVGNNPPLTAIFIKNGSTADLLAPVYNSPNLAYVCVDDGQYDTVRSDLNFYGHSSTVLNSYCSFEPGGDYNTVTGNIRFDANNNGCDVGDAAATFVRVNIAGTGSGSGYLNGSGNYTFYTGSGNHVLTPQLELPQYFNVSPVSATANFPVVDNSTLVRDFCLTPNGYHPDMEIVLAPMNTARPGMIARYQLTYRNKGNQTMSGQINLAFDGDKTDFVTASTIPTAQTDHSLAWSYANLLPFEVRTIDFALSVHAPTDVPPVQVGDVLHFLAGLNDFEGDATPQDNTFLFDQIVVNSFDPNDKTCLEGEIVTPEKIGEYLHYNINFENVGTADAINVVVKDIIDITMFDLSSLQIINASHPMRALLTDNKLEFIFENINLPPSITNPIGGHGNVLFKIKTLPTLEAGDMVTNAANIYFDYNHPIVTNEARTTFNLLKRNEFNTDPSVAVYPNPARNIVHIKANSIIKNVALFDVQGRILQTSVENKNTTTLDLSTKSKGIYFLKITTADGIKVEKIIKE